jgi:2'-5' RNA ligase
VTDPVGKHPAAKRVDSVGRLFIGCTLTEPVRVALQHALPLEALPGRAVPPENWHLTFRFLGETPKELYPKLIDALGRDSLGDAAEISFGGYGAFPRIDRAAVLWLGITDGIDALNRIAHRVESAVQRAGFAAEQRPFNAHLTLSRLKPSRDVSDDITRLPVITARMRALRGHRALCTGQFVKRFTGYLYRIPATAAPDIADDHSDRNSSDRSSP